LPNPNLVIMTEIPQAGSSAAVSRPRKSRWLIWTVLVLLAAAAAYGWFWLRPAAQIAPDSNGAGAMSAGAGAPPGGATGGANKGGGGRFDPNRPTPISAVAAKQANLPVRLSALGTVTARSTVTVKSRVDGQLMSVNFREGELVKAGQLLAQIDPRPFEVALAQAQAQLARDQAQLQSAKVDLARYQGLLATDSIAGQQVDTQAAQVLQLDAAVAADRAVVDNAKLQLSYTRINAPVAGRAGLRQVDAGNLVRSGDASGIVTVAEIEPIYVVFPLPQDNLPAVLARLKSGEKLPVVALDRDGRARLATGRLQTTDNTIDPTTGTIKLKAEFDNRDGALFPNQFVNVRLLLDTMQDATVVPSSAIQRGAPGTYVYVIKDDATVTVRTVKLGPADGESTAIAEGLAVGERVVSDGADKLREGAKVEVIDPNAQANGARPRSGEGKGEKGGRAAVDAEAKPGRSGVGRDTAGADTDRGQARSYSTVPEQGSGGPMKKGDGGPPKAPQ
jgi:multidrug efflux system membrane fusion protein